MKKIFTSLLLVLVCFSLVGCGNEENNPNTNVQKEEQKNYGVMEREPIQITVAKLNTEIMDNGLEYLASEDYLVIENDIYWYGIYDDISLYIIPEKFTGDKTKDITKMITFFIDKNSPNDDLVLEYVKKLIKANNTSYTDEEISKLVDEAKSGKRVNDGKGIFFEIVEANKTIEYQVTRIYV